MIDININAIISQALAAAVQQAIQPLQQEYANKMAEMAEKIAKLETQSANRHERLRALEGALTDRVAALENQALVVSDAVDKRLLALENNPAQGVDTTLNAWEMAMQNRVASADAVAQRMHERVLALEMHTAVLDQHGGIVEYLDNQEWFWDKIRRFTDGAVESAVEQHCEEYDHDDMVMKHELPDMDDYVTKDSFRDEIEDVLNNATLSIRF